ncbi:MAG: UvrD-helicase domain-containing protein [Pseudomonadota bacterium]
MNTLNSKQQQAVRHVRSPLLVLAGAGSGKTRVITEKIAWLVNRCNYKANQIAAVTFTNKAAREMKERVKKVLPGNQSRGLTVSTFHTLGLKIIRSEAKQLDLRHNFTIYDANDSKALLKNLLVAQLSSADLVEELIGELQQLIGQWKNACLLPHRIKPSTLENQLNSELFILLYQQYNDYLHSYNAVDFDDLILLPVLLFNSQPQTLLKWQKKIRYLLVDEYQDTNIAQYRLVKLLASENKSANLAAAGLTVVGDDDQSIYCWRGARPENLAQLEHDFKDIEVVKLEQNYRSYARILKAANQLIQHNPHVFEKKLWSDLGYGVPIKVIRARDEFKEVESVISSIVYHHFSQSKQYSDFAILYRGNHQSRLFEKQLREQQIPYKIAGGPSFFSYTEIKDILSYLKILINPQDDSAFLRVINVPRRQIGTSTIQKLSDYSKKVNQPLFNCCLGIGINQFIDKKAINKLQEFCNWINRIGELSRELSPVKAVSQLITDMDYYAWLIETSSTEAKAQRRIENVNELVEWLQRLYDLEVEKNINSSNEVELSDIVNKMILLNILEQNEEEQETNCVSLMTLHSAKGLEFPHVYMVGMEEELLPHRTSIEEDNIEEERRLCYVGITRAREQLTLTMAAKRRRFGEDIDCEPSRFISELPEEDLQWINGKEKLQGSEKKTFVGSHLANIRAMLDD